MTIAIVPTANASRYLQQLCKHWSHKMEVEFTPEAGRIAFPLGPVEMAASPETLSVRCTPNDPAETAKMQQVIADHLNRFAFKEGELVFDWQES